MDESTNVVKKKAILLRDLQKSGVSISSLKGKRARNMKDLAMLKNVATLKRVQKERVKVWIGNPKGVLQIL